MLSKLQAGRVESPYGRDGMKIALAGAGLLWLLTWGIVAWRAGYGAPALVAYALIVAAVACFAVLGFAPARALRSVAAVGAFSLTLAVAVATFMDLRLVAGTLAVAASASIPPPSASASAGRKREGRARA